MTIIDTPEGIEMYRLLALKAALKLDIDTGLTHSRGSTLRAVNEVLIRNEVITVPFRLKKTALEALEKYIEEKAAAWITKYGGNDD